jgi:YidC/Oxa1 family membrane protein insertase|tara:strand:+ start:419 stop:2209 length:1791 start_codon:yes stop_codon:yes gene_type:complete
MEENRNDPLTFIGFLLISIIIMFWYYSNQSIPAIVENDAEIIENTISEDELLIDNKPKEIKKENKYDFEQKKIVLENDKIYLEIDTKGANITLLNLKEYTNYNDESLMLVDLDNSSLNISLPDNQNSRIIDSKDIIFDSDILEENKKIKLTGYISDDDSIEIIYNLDNDSFMLDYQLKFNGFQTYQNQNDFYISWIKDSFRNSKSLDYENRYTALSYGFEDEKDSYLSITGSSDKIIDDVNWISYREHFFSSILMFEDKLDKIQIFSENLASIDELEKKYTKRFSTIIPIEINNSTSDFRFYFGPTDYDSLKEYNLGIENSVPVGWGIFGWINTFIFFPLFSFLTKYFSYGISIIVLTIIVKILIAPITYKQYLSQAKMKVLKPEIEEINEKYKDDPMKRQQETMSLYTRSGANPMAGCLPALAQMPIFFALFVFFPAAFSLRQKSFLWADDLSSYDSILDFGFYIPLYGDHISLFPILASVAIFFYTKMTTGGQMMPASQTGGVNMKLIMYLMPLMMLFFFNNYASGLSLYYFVSNLLTIMLMLLIKRFYIDDKKILREIEQNKQKPIKVGGFRARLQKAMEEAEKQKRNNERKS